MGVGRHGYGALLSAVVVGLLTVGLTTGLAVGAAAEPGTVVNTVPPTVAGQAVYDRVLRAEPGTWEPSDVTFAYAWLRDGEKVAGAKAATYRLGLDDLGHAMSVRVTATDQGGATASATSEQTAKVAKATLRNRRLPEVSGTARFGRTVRASTGRWSSTPARVRFQWLRDGDKIAKATSRRYRFAPGDVGRRVQVRVRVNAPGYRASEAVSPGRGRVGHRVAVRRTVRYHVETRGRITTSLKAFRRLAQQSYEDPRGWRGSGTRFVRVARGGAFTLVLAEASRVPVFSSSCSSTWSCRVGRYVIINQERWKHASPAWNAAHGSLRDYRHMVVNHETGHWLGLGHSGCPGRGQAAPVMMQQSKGLDGCRFNPWPTGPELRRG